MGQLYSHLLFRPPTICTYQCTNGQLRYVVPDKDGLPAVHSTELIWLMTTKRNRIPCVLLRQPDAEFVILYAHQNAEDLGTSVRDAHILSRDLAVDVLAFEYSGYGLSEKPARAHFPPFHYHPHHVSPSFLEADRARAEPSEKACCSDIIAAYAYLTDHCRIPSSRIILFGRSIGSGPAVYCATTKKVGGLVLIAPIASAVRVPLKRLNVTLPFIDTFPNIDRASKIKCPVLVVHGDMDELVPKLQAERLFEKINQNGHAVNPLWIPNARHNNVVEDFHSIVFNRYLSFIDEIKAIKADRRSIEDLPRDALASRNQMDREGSRPILPIRPHRLVVACLRPSRTSLELINSTTPPPCQRDTSHRTNYSASIKTCHRRPSPRLRLRPNHCPGFIEHSPPPSNTPLPSRTQISPPMFRTCLPSSNPSHSFSHEPLTRYESSSNGTVHVTNSSWQAVRKSLQGFDHQQTT